MVVVWVVAQPASADPSRLALLADADLAFVVDPVDGTANFAAGLPLFGVMAAAIVRGEVVAAAIHDPICDDMALALRGEGAWTESPGGARTDLRVAAPVPVAEMTGNVSWRYLPEPPHAPGWLLHQEAGGYSARLDGSDYTPLQTDGGLICAPDRASWQAVRTILLQVD